MDKPFLLYFICVLAGFALIRVPLNGALAGLDPICNLIGALVAIVFSVVLIVLGVLVLFRRL